MTDALEAAVRECHLANLAIGRAMYAAGADSLNPDAAAAVKRNAATLEQIFQQPGRDLFARTQSTNPLVYVISYPRSGNTMLTSLLADVLDGQVLMAMPGSLNPFSKSVYPVEYPVPRIIKDHVAREHYRDDRCIILMRDGRDAVLSFAYFTHKNGNHPFWRRDELADAIRWIDRHHIYGGWAAHAGQARRLLAHGHKLFLQYADLHNNVGAFERAVSFAANGSKAVVDLKSAFANRNRYFERIGRNPAANRLWGVGVEEPPESLFHEWSRNRQGSNWHTWPREAKRAFHDTGATDHLLEFGFETDPLWWKN